MLSATRLRPDCAGSREEQTKKKTYRPTLGETGKGDQIGVRVEEGGDVGDQQCSCVHGVETERDGQDRVAQGKRRR